MEAICGECNKPYSEKCEIKTPCRIHNKSCFQCLECKQPQNNLMIKQSMQVCFQCADQCRAEESFYQVRCNIFICKKEFKGFDLLAKEIKLPCGCLQLKQHVVAFMSNFCFQCLRKLKVPQPNQVRLCTPCFRKSENLPPLKGYTTKTIDKNAEKSNLLSWLLPLKTFFNTQTSNLKIPEKQIDHENKKSEKLIIQMLNQDFKKTEEQLRVSQFTRIQLRKYLLTVQRDKQCLICSLAYSLSNKPVMICLQQHLICQKCFKQKLTLRNCPLCSEQIQKDKVRISRERLRTLQLENIMMEKFENKHKRYQSFCKNDFQALRYKFEVKDAQTQTDKQLTKQVVEVPVPNIPMSPVTKKRGKPATNPQQGEKRQKKCS